MGEVDRAVGGEELRDLLGQWSARRPLFRALASALLGLLQTRQVPPGTLLPPERELSALLGLSRPTVSAAYRLLREAGWVDSRQGRGTWVTGPRDDRPRPPGPCRRGGGDVYVSALTRGEGLSIDLTAAALPAHPEVLASWGAVAAALVPLMRDDGYVPRGLAALRTLIAADLTAAGVPTAAEEVVVTTGATQALALAAVTLLWPGAPVLVEEPTSPVILAVLRAAGASCVPVPTDGLGPVLQRVVDELPRVRPAAMVLTPSFADPTAAVTGPGRRAALAGLAARGELVVIEDLATADLRLAGAPPAPVAAHAPDAPILSVGSLGKLFWCGLRVGWIRGPPWLIARLAYHKVVQDLGTPLTAQAQAAYLLTRRVAVIADRRAQLQARLRHVEEALGALLPDWTWTRPRGGVSLWLQLPAPLAGQLVQRCMRRGLALLPGSSFSCRHAFPDRIRMPYVLEEPALTSAVEIMADCWHAVLARPGPRPEPRQPHPLHLRS